jgi:hypothetical protein
MILEDLLSLLQGVRRSSRGWIGRCPAHADQSPSLSIHEGDDQRILLHCFSGCTALEMCTALRLSLADLFPANKKPAHQIQHESRQRQAAHVAQAQQQHARGLALDVLRQAEHLLSKARGFPESHTWSNARRERMLNQVADAYDVLDREGMLNESVGI